MTPLLTGRAYLVEVHIVPPGVEERRASVSAVGSWQRHGFEAVTAVVNQPPRGHVQPLPETRVS